MEGDDPSRYRGRMGEILIGLEPLSIEAHRV